MKFKYAVLDFHAFTTQLFLYMEYFLFQNESKYEPDYVVKITDRVHFSYKIYFTPIMNNETVILEKNIGLIYSDVSTLKMALRKLESSPDFFKQLGENAVKVYAKDFSGQIVYEKIINNLEILTKKND